VNNQARPQEIDPSLRLVAVIMPRGKGLVTRRLRLSRIAVAGAERVLGLRGVEVARISPTASVRVHRPSDATGPLPAVLWIHGGGYVLGSARVEDRKARHIADVLGAAVVAVDYRLAPENPYPAALDDCYAALGWLVAQPDIDSRRIVVSGVSAGGGLAAALTLKCVDTGLVDLAGQVLQYPMLDDRTTLKSITSALGWTPEDNRFGWRSYLDADVGAGEVSAYAVPARRKDLAGLPPTWIGVGTADLFHDEDVDYATRLQAAGVPTQLEVIRGAFHGFDFAANNELARSFKATRLAATRHFLTQG
jgi:acetyl esterase/lipase